MPSEPHSCVIGSGGCGKGRANSPFRRFVVGQENFIINKSRYSNDTQTVSRRINRARSLVNSIDQNRQRNLSTQIQELLAKKKELETQTRTLLQEDKAIQTAMARYDQQINDLKAQRRDRVGAQRQWEKDSALIEARRRELRAKEQEPNAEERRRQLNKEIRRLAQRRSIKMQDLVALTVQMSKVSDRRHAASLGKWQWDATRTQLDNLLHDQQESEKELARSTTRLNRHTLVPVARHKLHANVYSGLSMRLVISLQTSIQMTKIC